jgi:hypothetical protein
VGWVERYQKRRRELAEGVDADLVQANRRRFRAAFGLVCIAVVLVLLDAKLRLPDLPSVVLRIGALISGVVGIVLGKWAQAEREFLTRPDPEHPPEIFNNKP